MHVATDECFLGVGCWHPEAEALGRMRSLVAGKSDKWLAARDHPDFLAHWKLDGDKLTRPPRGYAADHPAIEDIKRKDFVAPVPLSFDEITGSHLVELASQRFSETQAFMKFLCEALGVPY